MCVLHCVVNLYGADCVCALQSNTPNLPRNHMLGHCLKLNVSLVYCVYWSVLCMVQIVSVPCSLILPTFNLSTHICVIIKYDHVMLNLTSYYHCTYLLTWEFPVYSPYSPVQQRADPRRCPVDRCYWGRFLSNWGWSWGLTIAPYNTSLTAYSHSAWVIKNV